eukprot:3049005-Pyramimonas_sp.AAC.1
MVVGSGVVWPVVCCVMLDVGANPRGGESIFFTWKPIAGGGKSISTVHARETPPSVQALEPGFKVLQKGFPPGRAQDNPTTQRSV